MKRLLTLFVFLVIVLFSQSVIAQEMGSLNKRFQFPFHEKIQAPPGNPLPAGIYSIGTSGDFPTIDSAFNKLSVDGIAGEVTLELIDTLFIAPSDTFGFTLIGPIPGAGTNSRVTIKPAANTNVTIQGNGRVVLSFLNTSFITIDGIGLTGTSTLTVHAILNTQLPFNDAIEFFDDSDNNIVRNTTIISEDYTRYGAGIIFVSYLNTSVAPDNNIIQGNHIKRSSFAIYITAYNSNIYASNNIIRRNIVGSETDNLTSWGIQIEKNQNTIIDSNLVQNINNYNPNFYYTIGINSYWCTGCITRNNVVHTLSSLSPGGSVGILLSGDAGNIGADNLIYNNMVCDIQSSTTQSDGRVAGIQFWAQNNPKIYYNSVYVSGNGANRKGSAALYIYSGFGNSTNVEVKNNILVNTRDESIYCASAIYDYSSSNLTSDYNDLYYEPNQYNALVRIGSTNYGNLADWQMGLGQDANSVSKEVFFVSSSDLHLTGSSNGDVDLIGTPIGGITTDIDGEDRSTNYPYMGADEGTIPLPVELTSFTANTVGNEIRLSWQTATEINNKGFEIYRNGNKITFVEGRGTTTEIQDYSYIDKNLQSEIYNYRLNQIDYDGTQKVVGELTVYLSLPEQFSLEQNYPNPFNPSTKIKYSIPHSSQVQIKVFDALGNEIETLINKDKPAGTYELNWNAANLPNGVYFYQIKAGSFVQTKKMILIK